MRYLFILCFTGPLLSLQAQITFDSSSVDDAMLRAKEENKLIFVYGYTKWCEPCEEMEAYTFSDLEVSNFWKKHFVSIALDMEDYPGIALVDQYAIDYFPSFLFLDGEGQIVHRGCAGMDASEFLNFGKSSINDTLKLAYFNTKYQAGERSTEFMLMYLDLMEYLCIDVESFAAGYLKSIPLERLSEETPWAVFSAYQWDIYSKEFKYLMAHRKQFEEVIGAEVVNTKIYDTFLSQYQEVYQAEELHDFGMRALLEAIGKVSFSGSDTLKVMMDLHYSEYVQDWSTYAEKAVEFVGMANVKNPEELGELAWNFYLFVEDERQLLVAASWAKEAVDLLPDPSMIDTYASLQFKLGKKKEAVALEEKAMELAKELGDDLSHYQYQLKKFSGQ